MTKSFFFSTTFLFLHPCLKLLNFHSSNNEKHCINRLKNEILKSFRVLKSTNVFHYLPLFLIETNLSFMHYKTFV